MGDVEVAPVIIDSADDYLLGLRLSTIGARRASRPAILCDVE